jgi:MFS family permease
MTIDLARRNALILAAAQAFLGAQLPMVFVIGGLVGQSLAPHRCLATLPISMIVIGSMLSTQPLSALMQRRGRRFGFVTGALGASLGAMVGAAALLTSNFYLFLLSGLLTGIYMAAQALYRFAATDTAPPEYRGKAVSMVMAGGLFAALIGPQFVKVSADAMAVPFLGTYLGVVAINLVGALLFLALRIPRPPAPEAGAPRGRSRRELLASPAILVAIICAMVSYALMNLVMTSTPLAVVGCGFSTGAAADVVTGHVLAMYAPSFFTGHLIARFGARRITGLGLAILAAAGLVGLAGVELMNFFVALILLGVGWNFGFIGATTMLTAQHGVEERARVQGMNDALVFGGVVLASMASGGLMNCAGADAQAGWAAVNLAMLPLLALAGGALMWLWSRPRDVAAE